MCHHGHRINFAVSLRSPTRDLEDGRRDSGLGSIRNIADVRGQPPPPPRSRPDARTRGLPGAEARPDPKGSGQPLPSHCSSPADEAATASSPPTREQRRRAPSRRPAQAQMEPERSQIWAAGAPPATSTATPFRDQRPRRRTRALTHRWIWQKRFFFRPIYDVFIMHW